MRKLSLLTIVLLLTLSCFAQDIIVTKDGKKINAVISEIELEVVKYKNYDNQSGPTISIRRIDIASIVYQNGGVEVFSEKLETSILPTPAQKALADYRGLPEYQSAKNLYATGVVFASIGAGLMFSGLFVGLFADMFVGFVILVPIGAGMMIPGAICSGIGNGRMSSIRNQNSHMYSHNLFKTEKSQLNLNVNPNSVGLSLRF